MSQQIPSGATPFAQPTGTMSGQGIPQKARGKRPYIIGGCGGCFVLVVLLIIAAALGAPKSGTVGSSNGGSTSPSSSSSSAPTATVGTSLTAQDGLGDQAVITVTGVTYTKSGTGALATAPQNGLYAIVSVKIKCTEGQWTADPLFFEYQLSDGTTYTADNGNSVVGTGSQLDTETLSPGQSTSGNVPFDVTAAGGKLKVQDDSQDIVGTWQLPATSTN